MMIAPATTSPTAKPIIESLPTPLLCVVALFGGAVASVFVLGVVNNRLSEDVTRDGEAVDDGAVVDEDNDEEEDGDAGDDNDTDPLALPSRVRYQLVLQTRR